MPTSIFAAQIPSQRISKPDDIALNYIRDGSTFRFDGITTTLKIVNVITDKSDSSKYTVTISFQCLHGGYGDRTDKIVTQEVTPHTAVVTVVGGKVVSAFVDGSWNEVAQRPIINDDIKASVEAIALSWLIKAPTFKFDGVEGSANVVNSWLAMTFVAPSFWEVTIEFDCLHTGYGDRNNQILAQVITHHVATIHVTDGSINYAIIDNAWDEVKQHELTPVSAILLPEQARDIAINYIIQKFGLDGALPSEWSVEDLTPQGLVGSQKTRYTSGDWVVTIEHAVVWKPMYNVTVEFGSTISWTGNVEQSGSVQSYESVRPSVPQLIYTPDIARKICIDYLIAKHPEVVAQIPIEWTEKNLVPVGIIGLTNVQYTSGGWTITVSAPVVWKPTHSVSINYKAPGGTFTWEGTLPQGGPVTEISFIK